MSLWKEKRINENVGLKIGYQKEQNSYTNVFMVLKVRPNDGQNYLKMDEETCLILLCHKFLIVKD